LRQGVKSGKFIQIRDSFKVAKAGAAKAATKTVAKKAATKVGNALLPA
jgi:hypothetical protein